MTKLPITLCAIDCANPLASLRALDLSMRQLPFSDVAFLTDRPERYVLPDCRMVGISPISSRAEYSRFVVKELQRYFDTSHVMLVQWDGYVVDGSQWIPEFLDFDYIGAPWGFHHDAHRVGNGGFSIRSRRLIQALADPEIVNTDPEDEMICRHYRPYLEERHGIRFAPEDIAARFSFETTYPPGSTLGFHGLFNMWMHLHRDELAGFVAELAPATVAGRQFLQLGQNYLELGRRDEAAVVLRRRLEVAPQDSAAAQLLSAATSTAASSVRRNDPCPCGSGKRYKQCCGRNNESSKANMPSPPMTESLLGEAMRKHQAGRLDEAQALYGQVLRLKPDDAIAGQYLGVLAMQRGDPVRGEEMIRAAIARRPAMPDFYNNLGLCLRMQDRLEEAVAAYEAALRIDPAYAEAHNNLGLDLLALGRPAAAATSSRRAVELRPQMAEAHWNLGLSYLVQGDFTNGWPEFEWRVKCSAHAAHYATSPNLPVWSGEPLAGKTLLVRREQGLGDAIQCLRFLPQLTGQGAHVLLDINPELAALVNAAFPDVAGLAEATSPPAADFRVNLMSLPLRLGVSAEHLPGRVPYLRADLDKVRAWQHFLARYHGVRIGIVWAGNPKHANDRNRSCPLALLGPLFAVQGVTWFSLQKGHARSQLDRIDKDVVNDLDAELHDMSDTAAVIEALDLVISVDTSVVHLAGALGKPVWAMIPYAPDWRWLLNREDSPWYPSLRLFRQQTRGDWVGVVNCIAEKLEVLSRAGRLPVS